MSSLSLYDQYHSEINMKNMYSVLNELLQTKFNITINSINDYNLFINNYKLIFDKTKTKNIVDLNKEMLEYQLREFTKLYINNSNENNNNISDENVNNKSKNSIYSKYNQFISLDNKLNDSSKPQLTPPLTLNVEDPSNMTTSLDIKQVSNSNNIEDNIDNEFVLSSSNRNTNTSRYKYVLNDCNKINTISKIILPIEHTNHFTSPILKIKIKELKYESLLSLKETYKLNNYNYGVYTPMKSTITNNSNTLTIEFTSLYDSTEYQSDIYKCKITNGNCIQNIDLEDFKINDIIKISDDNNVEYSKIININENCIIIEDLVNEFVDDVYILNMNLQNIIICR